MKKIFFSLCRLRRDFQYGIISLSLLSGLSAIILSGCESLSDENAKIAATVSGVKNIFAPDTRVAIFDVAAHWTNRGLVVNGEMNNPEAKKVLLDSLSSFVFRVIDSVNVITGPGKGEPAWGIVRISVANMRVKPAEQSELASQSLMGTVIRLWKVQRGWSYVQTPDRYLGWMDNDSFIKASEAGAEAWMNAKKIIVTDLTGRVWQTPDMNSYPVSDVVAGSLLKDDGKVGTWTKIELPDRRTGYLLSNGVTDYETWKKITKPTPDGIEHFAKLMIGIPYLWGGASTKAVDCSGFTKTVFMMNGLQLNRDANQQADEGLDIPVDEHFSNLRKGDLLFFGKKATAFMPEKIVHVGIYLGDETFIHSSGMVRISSFDSASPLYDPYDLNRFVRARRILISPPQVAEVTQGHL
ncbi:MAG: C40 family peptidase [Bacteroidota bacterium]|nr:C40 family peptidase [Bacteroidota bacterium]